MKILAIETSCDDTCIALAECRTGRFKLISNLVSSQVEIHRKWGGVYPMLARREHQKNLTPILAQSLEEANLIESVKNQKSNFVSIPKSLPATQKRSFGGRGKCQKLKEILERESTLYEQLKEFLEKHQKPKIDLIAVTVGPGLDPCLWTGVNFAKALAYYWNLPIAPINHIEAHIVANWLEPIGSNVKCQMSNVKSIPKSKCQNKKIKFPAIALIVSGGHTQLMLMKNFGKYKILGETRDDAAGEAFDKIARILGLGYPGGPAIAAVAEKARVPASGWGFSLPRPMLNTKNYDFSFSGLKTAVLYNYKKRTKKQRESKKYVREMACEAQQAIIDVLSKKTIKAAKDYKAKSILLGGGVTANKELKKQFRQKIQKENSRFEFHVPYSMFSTDNAAMIAITACIKTVKGQTFDNWQKITAQPNLRINEARPRNEAGSR
jgi:N6-L-threonylcarbamoyladenine synthase